METTAAGGGLEGANEVMWPVAAAVTTTDRRVRPAAARRRVRPASSSRCCRSASSCASIASLFECLVILPAHYLDFGSRRNASANGAGGTSGAGSARISAIAKLRGSRWTVASIWLRAGATSALLRARGPTPLRVSPCCFVAVPRRRRRSWRDAAARSCSSRASTSNFNGDASRRRRTASLERTSARVVGSHRGRACATMRGDDLTDFNTIDRTLAIDLNYDRIIAPNLSLTYGRHSSRPRRTRLQPAGASSSAYAERLAHRVPDEPMPNDLVELRVGAGAPTDRRSEGPSRSGSRARTSALNKSHRGRAEGLPRDDPGRLRDRRQPEGGAAGDPPGDRRRARGGVRADLRRSRARAARRERRRR